MDERERTFSRLLSISGGGKRSSAVNKMALSKTS